MPETERTHISHEVILDLVREVSAQGAKVEGLTQEVKRGNDLRAEVMVVMREEIKELSQARDLQIVRCNQRFRDVEKQVFPGIQANSRKFWLVLGVLIAAINGVITIVSRLIM